MLRQLQTLVGTMMSSLVMIGVVLALVVPAEERFDAPPLWLVAAQMVAGLAVHALVETVGYRTPALDPRLDRASAASRAYGVFTSGTIVRFALPETVALVSAAAVLALDPSTVMSYLTGGLVALGLIGFHAWPWQRPIDRTIAGLERSGGRSFLRERLGLPAQPGGEIQEL